MENRAPDATVALDARLPRSGNRAEIWLYLIPLGLIFDMAGYFPAPLRIWLTWALLAAPLCRRPGRIALEDGAGLMLALAARAYAPLPPVADRLLLLAAHQWIWRRAARVPGGVTQGLLFFTALHLFLFDSPAGHAATERLASAWNAAAGMVAGRGFNLGPSYLGMGPLLLCACLSGFAWRRGDRIAFLRTAVFVPVGLAITIILGDLLLEKCKFDVDLTWRLSYREPFGFRQMAGRLSDLAVLLAPFVFFAALLTAYASLHARSWKTVVLPKIPERGGARFALIPVLLPWLALMTVAVPPTAWRRPQAREVVFIDRGIVSFSKPTDARFGRGAGGMFGMFPEYVRLFGNTATVTPDVPAELDPKRQILVFTNLNAPTPDDEFRRIWDFVAAGGGLWVIGDHTFIKDGGHHINDLLAPCDIWLENDSAFFFPQGWFHGYRFPQGAPFGLLTEDGDNRPGFLVGASLGMRGPARPFMFGRFGYGDLGLEEPDARGSHMGDSTFQRDERLGDLPLVAGQRYGRGRVLVYGDTTSFFNHMLPGAYELLRASLSWFGEGPLWPAAESRGTRPAAMVLLLMLAAALVRGPTAALGTPARPGTCADSNGRGLCGIGATYRNGVIFCLTGLFLSAFIHRPSGLLPWDRDFARQHAVIVDFTHQPEASLHGNMPTGLHGVTLSLMRRGLLPIEPPAWRNDLLDRAAAVVFNAPRKPFNTAVRRALMRYMAEGGTVILACGYPHYEAVRPLLEPLGLRVLGKPLGRFFDRQAFGRRISFFSAWPIEVSRGADVAVLCVHDEWPLIVSAPVERGRLILIADSEFLQNRNLESSDRHDPANVQFVRTLFERINEESRPW